MLESDEVSTSNVLGTSAAGSVFLGAGGCNVEERRLRSRENRAAHTAPLDNKQD
jgi:hypothetical protein